MEPSVTKQIELTAMIELSILRQEVSSRGGGIEISLDRFGKQFQGERMSAYQNYLGGGILGKIQVNDTIRRQTLTTTKAKAKKLDDIGYCLMQYFHMLSNHEDDEYESETFEQNQNKPKAAY